MDSFILLSTFVLLITTCFIFWKRRSFYYTSYKLKGPFALPVIGNLFNLIKNPEDILEKLICFRKKFGSPFRIWFGTKLFVYTSNPEDFEILFNSPYALNKKEMYEFYKPLFKEGLVTCSDVPRWRRNRKLIAKMFNQEILNGFIQIFQENSLVLCEQLKEMVGEGSFDVHSWLIRCHGDIILETTTGVKVNAQQTQNEYLKCYQRLIDIIHERVLNVLLHPDFIYNRTALGKKQEKLTDYITNFNKNVIHSKREQDKYSESNKVLLDYFIKTGQFTDDELNAELAIFIVGGTDTGSAVESFTLMLLGMHQEVQDKVSEEQQGIFGDNQRDITYADLSKMHYLGRVLKESMRLFPVIGILFRTITDDIQLRTCKLPMGTTVMLGVLDAHRNTDLWEDPLKFDPDRFLSERVAKRHPYSYVPFSAGSRDCLGQRYGVMVMKVILSTIVRKYRIYCNYKNVEDIKIVQHFTMFAKDGFQISLQLRN